MVDGSNTEHSWQKGMAEHSCLVPGRTVLEQRHERPSPDLRATPPQLTQMYLKAHIFDPPSQSQSQSD